MITVLDEQVGRIVETLKKKGLRENTLILFASDNGGATSGLFGSGARSDEERKASGSVGMHERPPASNDPLRGGKGSLYEGGVRVTAFANWPGKLMPRAVDEPMHMVDVMPTLLGLAGAQGSADHPFDGRDVWRTLSEGAPRPGEDVLIAVEAFRGAIPKGTGSS
jgi:arylsulfatase A-like enzyme